MNEQLKDEVRSTVISLLAAIVWLAVGPSILLFYVYPLVVDWYDSFNWTWSWELLSGSLWPVFCAIAGAVGACLLVVALGYLGYCLFHLAQFTAKGPARRLVLFALTIAIGSGLAGWRYLESGTLWQPAVALALAFGLSWWAFTSAERDLGDRVDCRWALRYASWPSLGLVLLVVQFASCTQHGVHLWQLPAFAQSTDEAAAGPDDGEPAEAPTGELKQHARQRLVLVIPKLVVDVGFYVYLDGRILTWRDYDLETSIYRTETGSYIYAPDGDLLAKRSDGRFVYLPPAPVPADAGLVYSLDDPRMANTALFEILIVDLEPGEHLVEFVSFIGDYGRSPDSPFVLWSSERVEVAAEQTKTVEAFRGVQSSASRLPIAVAAAPAVSADTSVDERIAIQTRQLRRFQRLLDEHPLALAFAHEAARMADQDHWFFRFPPEHGGERQYCHAQITAMGNWLLGMMQYERTLIP